MSTKLSQKEYLRKYLSGGSDKKKKKKDKKVKTKATTVKIIDDDVHVGNSLDDDEEVILTGEDAPQIVGVYEATITNGVSKWKKLGESEPEIKQEIPKDDDPWGKKATSQTLDLPSPADRSPSRRMMPMTRNSDQSPPRKNSGNRFKVTRDQSPIRKGSPVYKKRDSDQSPPRKNSQSRMSKNSDQSPERRHGSRWNTDQSPPRRRRDADQSPPRRRSAGRTSDQSPPRRRSPKHFDRPPPQRHARNDSDLSPVRIKRQHSTDQSPPRRRSNGNPFKTSVKLERESPDTSPVRPSRPRQDYDQSPPRIKRERISESPPPTHKSNSTKMTTTLDGKRAGLQDAKTLKLETEERRRIEDRMFNQMSKEVSGRDAEVQVRQSSSYRRRRKDLEEDPEVQRKKAEHEQKKKEIYDRWGKGLKQVEASDAKRSEDQYESSKPLARYSNDADLDEMLKQKERDDDPMLAYMRSKKKEQLKAANVPVMPMYKGSFPENRFAIPPGYRWDGVDRSNGYEQKWFDVQNQKKALEDEAYKYSTEDM